MLTNDFVGITKPFIPSNAVGKHVILKNGNYVAGTLAKKL